MVRYVIQKDGHVSETQWVEGMPQMGKTLEQSLRKLEFRPFVVRGEPVEAEVQENSRYDVFPRVAQCGRVAHAQARVPRVS